MLDPQYLPDVDPGELLARYVTHKKFIRENGTVRESLFIPYKYVELSVTRHRQCTEQELLDAGKDVASQLGASLLGRADVITSVCLSLGLIVSKDPLPNNPNHANIADFPELKSEQKSYGQQLAANAHFVEYH